MGSTLFHAKSTRLKPSLFFLNHVIDCYKKNDLHQFSDCIENFFGSKGRNCRFVTEDHYRFI